MVEAPDRLTRRLEGGCSTVEHVTFNHLLWLTPPDPSTDLLLWEQMR